jgi:hypothetical protein
MRSLRGLEESTLVAAAVNGGMITSTDPADIPNGALQLAINVRVAHDKIGRRYGTKILEPAAPDANDVIKVHYLKRQDGTTATLRITPSSVHKLGVAWTAIVGVLTGSASDRITIANILNEVVFANNGADDLQLVDLTGNTHGALGNAPAYRYVTGFFNRAVGAALRGSNEVQIGWSADGDITEWDPLVDESAGNTPLIDNPLDLGDHVRGIFTLNSLLVIPRDKSIWIAHKQPIPTNPFYFQNALPGIGTDAPFSGVVTQYGFSWVDTRTKGVYVWMPGSQFDPNNNNLALPIQNYLFENVNDPAGIYSTYSGKNNELYVCIPQASSNITLVGVFNFTTKTWVIHTFEDLTSLDVSELANATLQINQLAGTISGLVGSIDSLGLTETIAERKVFGQTNGDIHYESADMDLDQASQLVDVYTNESVWVGDNYTTELVSKDITVPTNDVYISSIRIDYIAQKAGTFNIYCSRDDGEWTLLKTVTITEILKHKIARIQKVIHARRLKFKITSESGLFEITHYEIKVYPSGASTK